MRRFVTCLVFVASLCALGAQTSRAEDAASQFMTNLGNRVLAIINDKQAPEAERRQQFRKLAEDSFEIPRIAQFVLGRYWRGASDEERQRFIGAFENYMVAVYWSRFSGYNGESLKVTGERDEGNGTILVRTEIMRPNSGQPPVKVDWSLTKRGDGFKIRDASLEGVSQALTYRDEFASIIERNGGKVSALISQLNQRAKG